MAVNRCLLGQAQTDRSTGTVDEAAERILEHLQVLFEYDYYQQLEYHSSRRTESRCECRKNTIITIIEIYSCSYIHQYTTQSCTVYTAVKAFLASMRRYEHAAAA